MVEKSSKLETAAISLKWIANISLLLFCLIMYLGIQGYSNPHIVLRWGALITFVIFVVIIPFSYIINIISDWKKSDDENIEEKDRKPKGKIVVEYLIPLLTLVILFFWAKFRKQAPLYGEHKTYNIFSVFGFGEPPYFGEILDLSNTIEMKNLNKKYKQTGGGISSIIKKIYIYILTTISTMTYIYGLSWITKTDGLVGSIISISSLIYATLGKAILGYVPQNEDLMDEYQDQGNWFYEFMQYRVYKDTWVSKLGALIRRFTLLGLDTESLDNIIDTDVYDNVLPRRLFGLKKWESLPYLWHWIILSSIGYGLGVIFLIIVYGMK